MDLTEAFAPGGGGEDLPKTDFFDFVVSPPPHCASADGVVSDEESFLHRGTAGCRAMGGYLQTHEDHESSHGVSPFIKETNNNTLTALPPVSTITGALSHHHQHHHHAHHHVRAQHGVQPTGGETTAMDQSECDYWGQEDDGKEQTCNILLEDLNKYCWSSSAHTNDGVIHSATGVPNDHHQTVGSGRAGCTVNDRQNTDGAIYTLTVLNNEANSMDALDCCKSPAPASGDSWSLRPNLDLDAILSMEPSSGEQDHEQQTSGDVSRSVNDRFHGPDGRGFTVPSSQYTTDDSGFVESKELCVRASSANCSGDNNNDWKLSDQNLQEVAAAAAAAVAVGAGDSAESLLRSALQGKLYTGPAQSVSSSSSSSQASAISMPVSASTALMVSDQQQQQQQQQQEDSMQACTDEDLLLSQLDQTTYRPGDYEKLKSIANEVVESYCSLEPVCNVSATTTVMYTLDPASGSLGTITLPADLGQVSTVTVVTAAQQDVLQQQQQQQQQQPAQRTDVDQQQQTQQSSQLQLPSARVGVSSKPPKKYVRRANRNNANGASNGGAGSDTGSNANQQQSSGSGGSPGSVQRKERSLHYCSICSKGFKDKYSVNVHIRTHTGEKPFACSLCGKSFRQKAHLAKHYQTHVSQKPAGIQQTTSGSGTGGGNNGNTSPTAETNATPSSASPAIASRTQVAVDPTGAACSPPS